MKKLLLCLIFLSLFFAFARAVRADPGATLSLSPTSGTYSSSFDVKVILDTGGEEVVGADIYINFNTTQLSISESDIKAGSGLSVGGKTISEGTIKFTAYNAEEKVSGSAVHLATLTFTPKTTGSTTLSLVFSEGQTSGDCTVPKGGTDILASVSGATYTLSEAGGTGTAGETTSPPPATVPTTASGEDITIFLALFALSLISSGILWITIP